MKAQRHTVTLSFVSPGPLPPLTGLADIAYHVCTHAWPRLGSMVIHSRPATREEAAKLDQLDQEQPQPEPATT